MLSGFSLVGVIGGMWWGLELMVVPLMCMWAWYRHACSDLWWLHNKLNLKSWSSKQEQGESKEHGPDLRAMGVRSIFPNAPRAVGAKYNCHGMTSPPSSSVPFPSPPSPTSNSIWPHPLTLCLLHTNSEAYPCNYTMSTVRLALD